jgi:hypothetical protein
MKKTKTKQITRTSLRDMLTNILEREESGIDDDDMFSTRYIDLADDLGIEWDAMINTLIELMDQLEELGQADFVLLRNEKFRQWWEGVKELREADAVSDQAAQKVADFINSLSSAERRSLGMK